MNFVLKINNNAYIYIYIYLLKEFESNCSKFAHK